MPNNAILRKGRLVVSDDQHEPEVFTEKADRVDLRQGHPRHSMVEDIPLALQREQLAADCSAFPGRVDPRLAVQQDDGEVGVCSNEPQPLRSPDCVDDY